MMKRFTALSYKRMASTFAAIFFLALSACGKSELSKLAETSKPSSLAKETSGQPSLMTETSNELLLLAQTSNQPAQGDEDSNQPLQVAQTSKPLSQLKLDLERSMAVMAVEFTVANFDSMQGGKTWNKNEIPTELASFMNSAQAQGSGRKFTYVVDQCSGPWQVVLKVAGETLQVTAYGSSTSQPLEQQSTPISQ